ncbi:MAG TPA: aminotransferase class V-fold PLP-dependent enzyme [Pyrinomonadaceae bacterium]|jgi:selenocysteine lyase/cysteine desulfurase|nr:aminotransferase class V-fold PLP-dependent enzyme [Pyrinomonadaceae bacterium]
MNEQIRSLFLAAQHYTYLNSAAVSPMPATAMKAVISQLVDVSGGGSIGYLGWLKRKESSRTLLAGMLNVRPEQVAFTRNTSDGIATIANGLTWKPGDNIVSFEGEFPANFYAWRRIRDEFGVELRMCPEREGRIDLDEFCSLIDHNTRVVAISVVQYASGFKADLERIGRAARAVDALFVVDLIQGLGAMGFDLDAQFVDAASGASHKWLCAPEGCGYIYLSDRARERVKPTLVGWISVETPWDFVDKEQPWRSTALAWESGTGCSALFYGLEQSLKLITDTGLDNIEQYVLGLSDQLCDGLGGKDYDIVSSRAPGEKTSIVCIKHRSGLSSNEIAAKLERQKIIVSPRGERLRIAPHFYNNSEDIDRLLEALP